MARTFNGTTDRIDYANVRDGAGAAQSFACWIDANSVSRANAQYLFAVHQSGDAALGLLFYLDNVGSLIYQQLASTTSMTRSSALSTMTTGKHHVAYTHTGSQSASTALLYIDGSQASYLLSTDGAGTNRAQAGKFTLGARIYDDVRNYDGEMWDAGYWNRVLTADEIAQLYAGYQPSHVAPDALLFAPELDENINCPWSGKSGTADGTTQSVSLGPSIGWGFPYAVKQPAAAPPASTANNLMLLGVG